MYDSLFDEIQTMDIEDLRKDSTVLNLRDRFEISVAKARDICRREYLRRKIDLHEEGETKDLLQLMFREMRST